MKEIAFGQNLKYYRKKHRLTQKQLADKIQYTEKSVSKWESGKGFPTIELLIKLAELFEISLDELILKNVSSNYFLGIDGGGTKTVFKLVDESGMVLNTVYKTSSNPNDIGMENAFSVLKEGITDTCKGIPYSKISMFAGLSGGGFTGENAAILNRFFKKFGFSSFNNGSDVENLIMLSDYEQYILVIMGTGFIVYSINKNIKKRISGWGQLFDEGGSGYTLGRDAVTAALSASDSSGEDTILQQILEEHIGETVEAHLSKIYQGGKKYIAELSSAVFKAAALGDKIALEILENNMAFVAQKIKSALKNFEQDLKTDNKIPVLFAGGISSKSDVIFPLINKHLENHNCSLMRIKSEPVDGAVMMARKLFEEKRR